MKKLLILTALCCCPLLSYGQTDGFMKLYEKYSGREGYTTVEMAGEMFRAINDADGTDSGAPGLNNTHLGPNRVQTFNTIHFRHQMIHKNNIISRLKTFL